MLAADGCTVQFRQVNLYLHLEIMKRDNLGLEQTKQIAVRSLKRLIANLIKVPYLNRRNVEICILQFFLIEDYSLLDAMILDSLETKEQQINLYQLILLNTLKKKESLRQNVGFITTLYKQRIICMYLVTIKTDHQETGTCKCCQFLPISQQNFMVQKLGRLLVQEIIILLIQTKDYLDLD